LGKGQRWLPLLPSLKQAVTSAQATPTRGPARREAAMAATPPRQPPCRDPCSSPSPHRHRAGGRAKGSCGGRRPCGKPLATKPDVLGADGTNTLAAARPARGGNAARLAPPGASRRGSAAPGSHTNPTGNGLLKLLKRGWDISSREGEKRWEKQATPVRKSFLERTGQQLKLCGPAWSRTRRFCPNSWWCRGVEGPSVAAGQWAGMASCRLGRVRGAGAPKGLEVMGRHERIL